MAEIMDPEGIMPREYAVLAAIEDQPGLDQRTLATRLGIDPATAGQMVDRLEGMGLVADENRIHHSVDAGGRADASVRAKDAAIEGGRR